METNMTSGQEDVIITPYEFNDLKRTVFSLYNDLKKTVDKVNNTDVIDKKIKDILEVIGNLENKLSTHIITVSDNTTIDLFNKEIIIGCDCKDNDVIIDLSNLKMEQKVTVSKMDESLNRLKIKTNNDVIFWSGSNQIELTSPFDTITLFKLTPKLIIGV